MYLSPKILLVILHQSCALNAEFSDPQRSTKADLRFGWHTSDSVFREECSKTINSQLPRAQLTKMAPFAVNTETQYSQ